MNRRTLLVSLASIGALGAGATALLGAGRGPAVQRVDFARTVTRTTPAYDARLQPAGEAPVKEFRIPITHASIEIAPGVKYDGWTFGGTVPGPTIRVREGDRVHINLVNDAPMPHSIDLHAAQIAPNVAYRTIAPHDSLQFEFTAEHPGAYMVHCGTPPVLMHLMQGMYFAMIVDPRGGWGTKADEEFVVVQSEFYTRQDSATGAVLPDYHAASDKRATYVVFNGRAAQYKSAPFTVKPGDRVRLFVVDAGPNYDSDFHIVGAIFDRVYADGNPRHALEGVQTQLIPAGGGTVFEAKLDEPGIYPFVTHAFADAEKGAVGMIKVGEPKQFATMEH